MTSFYEGALAIIQASLLKTLKKLEAHVEETFVGDKNAPCHRNGDSPIPNECDENLCQAHISLMLVLHMMDHFKALQHDKYVELGVADFRTMALSSESDKYVLKQSKIQKLCSEKGVDKYMRENLFSQGDTAFNWMKGLDDPGWEKLHDPGNSKEVSDLLKGNGMSIVELSDVLDAIVSKIWPKLDIQVDGDDLGYPDINEWDTRLKKLQDSQSCATTGNCESEHFSIPDSLANHMPMCIRWYDTKCAGQVATALQHLDDPETSLSVLDLVSTGESAPADPQKNKRALMLWADILVPYIHTERLLIRHNGKSLDDVYKALGSSAPDVWQTVCHKTLDQYQFCHESLEGRFKSFEKWVVPKGAKKISADTEAAFGYIRMLIARNTRIYRTLELATASQSMMVKCWSTNSYKDPACPNQGSASPQRVASAARVLAATGTAMERLPPPPEEL